MRKLVRVGAEKRKPGRNTGVDHTHLADKSAVRLHVLKCLADEGIDQPRVLDVFCGAGRLHRTVYGRTSAYLGLDQKQFDDDRRTIVCDNARFLRHKDADLDAFDVFDIDAYGSPSECLAIICRRLRWTRTKVIGICLTDGTGFISKVNGLPRGLLQYVGMSVHRGAHVQQFARETIFEALISRSCQEADAKPERMVNVAKSQSDSKSGITYIGYLMRHVG